MYIAAMSIAIGGIYSHVRTIHTVHLIPYTNISQLAYE